jgi:hypothetical protein
MKPVSPSLMDVLAPPLNPWLHKILGARPADLPDGVRQVRFEGPADDTDLDDLPPPLPKRRSVGKVSCPA